MGRPRRGQGSRPGSWTEQSSLAHSAKRGWGLLTWGPTPPAVRPGQGVAPKRGYWSLEAGRAHPLRGAGAALQKGPVLEGGHAVVHEIHLPGRGQSRSPHDAAPAAAAANLRSDAGKRNSNPAGGGAPESMPGESRLPVAARGLLGVGGGEGAAQATPSTRPETPSGRGRRARGEPGRPRPLSGCAGPSGSGPARGVPGVVSSAAVPACWSVREVIVAAAPLPYVCSAGCLSCLQPTFCLQAPASYIRPQPPPPPQLRPERKRDLRLDSD